MRRLFADRLVLATGLIVVLMAANTSSPFEPIASVCT
jgi:hypothetical protein